MLRVISRQFLLLKPWMQLNLVDCWCYTRRIDNSFEVRDRKIGYSDRFGTSLFLQLYQRFPGLHICVLTRLGPMDQIKIHVVEPKSAETFVQCAACIGVLVVPKFGGNK